MEHLGELIFFSFLAAVIIVPQVLKSLDRRRMYDTLRTAYERGQPVPPEMLEAMTRRTRIDPAPAPGSDIAFEGRYAPGRDLRRAVILIGVGLGLVGVGVAFYAGLYNVGGAAETLATFAASGAVPICIGLAYLVLWRLGQRKPRA